MSLQGELAFDEVDGDAAELFRLFEKADRLLVKKLSNNDRDWARFSNKHQAGVYMPHEQRDGGFFPPLEKKQRSEKDASPIRERYFTTIWPQADDEEKLTRLVHYTSKGPETHLTRLPKLVFKDLLPASFLIMGRIRYKGEYAYECLTIDSGSDDAAFLIELLDLEPDFLIGEFDPAAKKLEKRDRIFSFAEQVIQAWLAGKIHEFAKTNATMPNTTELARLAQAAFLKKYGYAEINPFALDYPGDVLRELSRSIEWELFKEFQKRERSVSMVRKVLGDKPVELSPSFVIKRLIDEYSAIDALMLSASQQRKARAGYSYEHHIEAMLLGGRIPFEKQVVIEAKKRPDFVLPSVKFMDSDTGLILSAKTTLRERWKQVEREKGSRNLYLTTVDENIAGNAIEDMASFGVHLVIPESLSKSKETEYAGHSNVLSFREFCDKVVEPRLKVWAA